MGFNLLTNHLLRTCCFSLILFILSFQSLAQEKLPAPGTDTIVLPADTLKKMVSKSQSLEKEIIYAANDSIVFDLPEKKVMLFGQATIHYKEISLKAARIRIDFKTNTVYAEGIVDSTGNQVGTPEFSEGSHEFRSKSLLYNFDTKKGIISSVITQEGEGFIHGNTIKKINDSVINIKTGKYTTCNLEHPHFEFRFTKSKVITDNKIITGPAYMSVADVPTPLAIPFGLFPNKKGQRNGILLPTYGESSSRGFYFENFGYYMGLSQYMDLELRADVYTLGSWAVKAASRYDLRYKFNGYFNVNYAFNKLGIPGSADYQNNRDFSVRWVHTQSDKARPNSRFSSNVNIVSGKYNQFNPTSTNAYLSNTFQSSISYQTNWDGKYFLTTSLSHSQNTIQKTVSATLPDISFSVNRFFPFSRKNRVGSAKWYEQISVNYQVVAQNTISTYDSLLFKPNSLSKFRNGMMHSITMSSPLKILKYFVLNNSISYKERWYSQIIDKELLTVFGDLPHDSLIIDTLSGFYTNREVSVSSSVSTILYGLVQFKKGPLKGIRHVITPTVSFSYIPGFGAYKYGFYKNYVDEKGLLKKYSIFEGALYGSPPIDNSGRVNFSIANNLEIKVRSRNDTLSGTKKIPIIENFSVSTSYDLAKDSLRWSYIVMNGRTRLFKDLNITYSSTWDPYVLDSTGTKNLNRFEWTENHRLLRLKNTSWNLSLNWSLKSKTKTPQKPAQASSTQMESLQNPQDDYVDFNIPWDLTLSYSLQYLSQISYVFLVKDRTDKVIQTFDFSGNVNITSKWKIGFRSGYDFQAKQLSYTSLDFYRDLHCWEMRFGWIPTGFRKSWNFSISVKSQLLQDLKLNKKKDFRDY